MAKTTVVKRKSRIPTKLALETIEELAGHLNTWKDIAISVQWKEETLKRNELAKDAYQRGMAECRKHLRRVQYEVAVNGNPNMLIWLGKIILGQKEVQELKTNDDGASFVSIGAFQPRDNE